MEAFKMAKLIDITGLTFGKWKVLEHKYKKNNAHYWLCKCECGNTAIVRGGSLKQGTSKSCGCVGKQKTVRRSTKHGGYGTRLYRIWDDMKARCNNPNSISYCNYGAKGITICDEWKDFKLFRDWALNNGYKENLTLDRINNKKGYNPSNCQWITMVEQQNNKSTNHFITFKGETLTMAQWARKLNFPYNLLCQRMSRGWAFEKAISTPKRKRRSLK